MDKIIKVSLFIFLSAYFLLENDVKFIGTLYFYVLGLLTIYDVAFHRRITLLTVWNLAYIFIINSEIFSEYFTVNSYTLSAVKYLVIANNLINLGYLSKDFLFVRGKPIKKREIPTNSKLVIPLLLSLVLFYFYSTFSDAIISFTSGRSSASDQGDGNFVVGSIINALGFILPAVLAYYFIHIKNSTIWKPLLFSAPIFILLFLGGTRFPLLFSFLGFAIVIQFKNKKKLKFKNYIHIIFILLSLLYASDAMKTIRGGGISASNGMEQKTEKYTNLVTYINGYFSQEGIIDMTSLMFRHFNSHPHLNGSSSSFILYFWVPRAIWPDKPTMLGHWFIREYRGGFGEGHSASFGFSGDLFADFGLFSLIPIFFLGRLLKIGDRFKDEALKSGNFKLILGAMIFPYVFFFVRSPITSTMSFLGIMFFYFLLKKLMFKKVKI